jgi:hypothetical protein
MIGLKGTTTNSNYKSLKLNFQGEIKRVVFPNSFEELQKLIPLVYPNITPEQIRACTISYIDDENDKVLISNEYDFKQATEFIEKANITLLKIFIDLIEPEMKREDSWKFEMINADKEDAEKSLDKIESSELNANDNLNQLNDDIIVQSLNEMRLSTDFAKSEIFSQDKEFVADSNDDVCKELVKNIEEKLILDTKEKFKDIKIEDMIKDDKLLGKKTNKEFNLYEFLMEKIKEVPPFEAMIDYIMQKRQAQKEKKPSNNLTVEKAKKSVRAQIAKAVKQQMKATEKKILSSLYKKADDEVEKIFSSKTKCQNSSVNNSTVVHSDVRCNGCSKKPIQGSRFKCAVCEDFDYCEQCEENNKDSHNHPFIKIRKPELEPTKIVTIIEDDGSDVLNHPNSDKLEKVKEKVKDYAGKYIQFHENVTHDLQRFFEKIKSDCPNFLNDLKPTKKFYDLFDCKDKKSDHNENENVKMNLESKSNNTENNSHKNITLSSKCVTTNLTISAINNTNEVRKSLKLQNDGTHAWPKFCYFTCIEEESAVKGQNVPLKIKVDPGKEINIEVCLNLKHIKEEGVYQSVWRLQNEKREPFGQKVNLSVDVQFSNDLKVDPIYHQNSSEDIFPEPRKVKTCAELLREKLILNKKIATSNKVESDTKEVDYTALMNQLKLNYNLQGIGDNRILYALVRAKGNKDVALDNLFSQSNFCDYHPKNLN